MSIEQISNDVNGLRSDIKSLTKMVRKIKSHIEDPTGEKKASRSANNGFNRKQNVSDELRRFLNMAPDEKISRSEVTKGINAYIKKNGLKDAANGRRIILDDELRALLRPDEGVEVTFLNLQKFVSPHILKEDETMTA